MKEKKFDQLAYQEEWKKKNMKQVKASYKADFVDEFKVACEMLGITQSDAIRGAMEQVILRAKKSK